MKLLIVDDENNARQAIHILLRNSDLGITEILDANSGARGLELLARHHPDIVFVDMKMPQMSGMEFMARAKERGFPGKIVVLSGFDDYAFMRSAIQNGASDYLLKPIDRKTLHSVLERLIGECRAAGPEVQKESLSSSLTRNGTWQQLLTPQSVLEISNNQALSILGLPEGVLRFGCLWTERIPEQLSQRITNLKEYLSETDSHIPYYWDCASSRLYLVTSAKNFSEEGWRALLSGIQHRLHGRGINSILFTSTLHSIGALYELVESMDTRLRTVNLCPGIPSYVDFRIPQSVVIPGEDDAVFTSNTFGALLSEGALTQCLAVVSDHMRTIAERKSLCFDQENFLYQRLYHRIVNQYGKKVLRKTDFPECLVFPLPPESFSQMLEEMLVQSIHAAFHISTISGDEMVSRIQEYIGIHYAQKIPVSTFVSMFFFSQEYILRTFKKKTGDSLHQYLIDFRMSKAQELLQYSNAKIYDIAQLVGYEDAGYFCQAFKKSCGMTPNQYRKKSAKPK